MTLEDQLARNEQNEAENEGIRDTIGRLDAPETTVSAGINANHRFGSFAGNLRILSSGLVVESWALPTPSAAKNAKWRLDRILKRKAEQGVKICVAVYQEVDPLITINLAHTELTTIAAGSIFVLAVRHQNQPLADARPTDFSRTVFPGQDIEVPPELRVRRGRSCNTNATDSGPSPLASANLHTFASTHKLSGPFNFPDAIGKLQSG
ncbi:hypothetical protein BGW80DRAFT_1447823 [Lactifluus volemus]|nr:hypothetical protein BGW80DRAFT_1447823 [Lactifluus volemus]